MPRYPGPVATGAFPFITSNRQSRRSRRRQRHRHDPESGMLWNKVGGSPVDA